MKNIRLSQWAKNNGYSYRGAYNRFVNGNIEGAFKAPTGTILIPIEQDNSLNLKTYIYARVSSSKQRDDLDRQADRLKQFCIASGYTIENTVKEVASGLNDKRPKFIELIKKKNVRIVIEHKDRLTRFGFNIIEQLIDGEIVVVNKNETDKDDLMQDLISVITSMVARYYGKRRGSAKTKEIINKL